MYRKLSAELSDFVKGEKKRQLVVGADLVSTMYCSVLVKGHFTLFSLIYFKLSVPVIFFRMDVTEFVRVKVLTKQTEKLLFCGIGFMSHRETCLAAQW